MFGHCSAVALFGLYQNRAKVTILNSLKIVKMIYITSSTNIFNGAGIRGKHSSSNDIP